MMAVLKVCFDNGCFKSFNDARVAGIDDIGVMLYSEGRKHLLMKDRILYITRTEDESIEPARSKPSLG